MLNQYIKDLPYGQINKGSVAGDVLYNLCCEPGTKTIVEIGTWNGLGTTRCIEQAIIDENKKDYEVYSLESNKEMLELALKHSKKLPNFYYLYGRVIEEQSLYWTTSKDFEGDLYSEKEYKSWLQGNITDYKNSPNVFDKLPEKIDLLVLDGGDFSSYPEFLLLENRSNMILLDDTRVLKNKKVRNLVLSNPDKYLVLMDLPNERQGFMLLQRVK